MAAPDIGVYESPTLGPDELEIFYVGSESSEGIYRSVRASLAGMFPPGQRIMELDAAVQRCNISVVTGIDLSADGLTVYIGCYGGGEFGSLLVARRSRIGAPFTVDPQDYGSVGARLSVSADELTAFSDGETVPSADPAPLMYTRSSTSTRFGSGAKIPGTEGTALVTLDLSLDGLWLFGAISTDLVVVRRDRPEATFGAPSTVVAGDPAQPQVWITDPQLSGDCRRLYYLHTIKLSPNQLNPVTSIRVIER